MTTMLEFIHCCRITCILTKC